MGRFNATTRRRLALLGAGLAALLFLISARFRLPEFGARKFVLDSLSNSSRALRLQSKLGREAWVAEFHAGGLELAQGLVRFALSPPQVPWYLRAWLRFESAAPALVPWVPKSLRRPILDQYRFHVSLPDSANSILSELGFSAAWELPMAEAAFIGRDEALQIRAAERLRGWVGPGSEQAITLLRPAAQSANPAVRMAAAESLNCIQDRIGRPLPELMERLRDRHITLQTLAILGAMGSNAFPALESLEDAHRRGGVGTNQRPRFLSELEFFAQAYHNTNVFRVESAIAAVRIARCDWALDFLRAELQPAVPAARRFSALSRVSEGLSREEASPLLPELLEAIECPDRSLSNLALRTVGSCGTPSPWLLARVHLRLKMYGELAAAQAVLALEPRDAEALTAVANYLKDPIAGLAAIDQLGMSGSAAREFLPELREQCTGTNALRRKIAGLAVRRIERLVAAEGPDSKL